MELIRILKRILYNFRKKHLITIIVVLLMLLIILSNFSKVFATTIDVVTDDEVTTNTINYLKNVVYTHFNEDFTEGISFVVYDETYECYRIIYVSSKNCSSTMGMFALSDWPLNEINFGWGNNCTLICYTIPFSGLTPTRESYFKSGWEANTFNGVTGYDCFNKFNLMWACAPTSWSNYSKIEEIRNNSYLIKPFSTYPFEMYEGNSFNINGNLIIDPGSCQVGENEFMPFMLEIQDITNSTLKARILLNTDSEYYDAEEQNYKISFENDLNFYLFNNIEYQFNIVLFNNDYLYDYKELFSLTWDGSYINPDIESDDSGESGDSGTTNDKDYTENFDNLENSINGTTSAIQDTNDFLKDESVDDSDFELPTVEVDDPSANFFDTIFTGVYDAVTIEEDVTIGIDVMNTHVKISSADFNFLVDERFSLIRTILSYSWIFGIGMFILRDIRKILDKIKNGDVDTAVTDDVKADMV